MENLIGGLGVFLICALCYLKALQSYRIGNQNVTLILILLAGLTLRIYVSMDFYLHEWDERYHALVAKNLTQHFLIPTLYENPILPYDLRSWISNHIWLHKPPVPLWIMALSLKTFGINEIALRIPSILFSTATIWMTFRIAEKLSGYKVAILGAFLMSIQGLIIEQSGGRVPTDHIDLYFLFFIEWAVLVALSISGLRLNAILTGFLVGLAIMCKSLPALIVVPIWFIWQTNKGYSKKVVLLNSMPLLITAMLVAAPWHYYITQSFPLESAWENRFNWRHITEGLEGHSGGPFYHLNKIRIIYGELIYLPLGWLGYRLFKRPNYSDWLIALWIAIPLLFFSFVKTKMPSYTLFIAPALIILTAQFWFHLKAIRKDYSRKWAISIIMGLILLLPIRHSIERTKLFQKRDRSPEWVQDLKDMEIKVGNQPVVIFNSERPIETMFYTNYVAYDHLPDSLTIDSLKSAGYLVIIDKKL